ncbi:hypothetical protein BZG36_01907 [Bifiguratus adelaidae]|uniref:Uncharacterized protein n=1 Tax=Bifiguratus adelaidae TaxID=1938954 RepID=A0A261Y4I3_9FUNG|nr:hypothetical protein BZG36_01907 [Bifiguratus adelaidae]
MTLKNSMVDSMDVMDAVEEVYDDAPSSPFLATASSSSFTFHDMNSNDITVFIAAALQKGQLDAQTLTDLIMADDTDLSELEIEIWSDEPLLETQRRQDLLQILSQTQQTESEAYLTVYSTTSASTSTFSLPHSSLWLSYTCFLGRLMLMGGIVTLVFRQTRRSMDEKCIEP